MGCDIHIWLEAKRHEKWVLKEGCACCDPHHRDYQVFAKIGNVRNSEIYHPDYLCRRLTNPPQITQTFGFEARGWPPDFHPPQEWYNSSDIHSRSWATLQEFLDAPWESIGYESMLCEWINGECVRKIVKEYGVESVRIVFGFDN